MLNFTDASVFLIVVIIAARTIILGLVIAADQCRAVCDGYVPETDFLVELFRELLDTAFK